MIQSIEQQINLAKENSIGGRCYVCMLIDKCNEQNWSWYVDDIFLHEINALSWFDRQNKTNRRARVWKCDLSGVDIHCVN